MGYCEQDVVQLNQNTDEQNIRCTIVQSLSEAMNTPLHRGIKIASAYTKKTGNETVFAYHTKKRKVMSAITAGNCDHSGEVDLDYLAKMDAGIFHTHPHSTTSKIKLPCFFSSTDLKYFAQENVSEAIVGCVDPKSNAIQLTTINLRIPKQEIVKLSDEIRKIHAKHLKNPYPYYPMKYKKLLKTNITYKV